MAPSGGEEQEAPSEKGRGYVESGGPLRQALGSCGHVEALGDATHVGCRGQHYSSTEYLSGEYWRCPKG